MPASIASGGGLDKIAIKRMLRAFGHRDASEKWHGRPNLLRLLLAVWALIASSGVALSDQPQEIKIGYLRQVPSRIRISLIDVPAGNDGLAGAQLATEDDNATGRFLNQHYTLIERLLGEGDDPVGAP